MYIPTINMLTYVSATNKLFSQIIQIFMIPNMKSPYLILKSGNPNFQWALLHRD